MFRLFRNLAPFTPFILLISLCMFGRAIAELLLPTLMSDIVDIGIITGDIPYILQRGIVMLAITLGGSLFAVAASYLSGRTAAAFSRDVRRKVFHRVESFSLHEFDEIGTASMITRTTNDITQVQQAVTTMLRMMLYAPMMAIGGIIMAVSKDQPLSVVLFVVIPVVILVVALIALRGLPLFKSNQQRLDRLNMVLRESLIGVRVIRAFNRTGHEQRRFERANRDLMEVSVKVNRLMAVMMPAMMLLFNFTTIAIIYFGSLRIEAGAMQVGALMAFIQYVMRIMFALIMMTMMFVMIPRAAVSAGRIQELLDREPDIRDPEKPAVMVGSAAAVEFRDVSFSYHGAEEPALCGISFTAAKRKVTAIIGGTGSGKSTIINLIPRFYDAGEGAVLVNGLDVRSCPQEELRARIGLVSQNSMLFSGSVRDNIAFGTPDTDDVRIRSAAETAQAAGFIEEMPDGYAATISQGGTNVSGGQKQRLAIARAWHSSREIYLLDDCFSALDYATEARLWQGIRQKSGDAAVIVVSQRVSTVMQADTIIVLDDGRIESQGTHSELLEISPIYREIAESQLAVEGIS